jgi:hypothetical protein
MALEDGKDAHGEKHTTPLSSEQDKGAPRLETAPVAPVPERLSTQYNIERGHKIFSSRALTSKFVPLIL